MNYIDTVALAIFQLADDCERPTNETEWALYRIYAVLALTTGLATTRENVHDAWSAWMAGFRPEHQSLRPFSELPEHVQALDQPYVDAIHAVAQEWQA